MGIACMVFIEVQGAQMHLLNIIFFLSFNMQSFVIKYKRLIEETMSAVKYLYNEVHVH
jgi:hypothetical protein